MSEPFLSHPGMDAGLTLPDGRRKVYVPWVGWRDQRPSPYFTSGRPRPVIARLWRSWRLRGQVRRARRYLRGRD